MVGVTVAGTEVGVLRIVLNPAKLHGWHRPDRARRVHRPPDTLTNDFIVNLLDMGTEWKASAWDEPRPVRPGLNRPQSLGCSMSCERYKGSPSWVISPSWVSR